VTRLAKIQTAVSPATRAYIRGMAAVEGVSMSAMAATLIREAVDARARERERIVREFRFPSVPWPSTGADTSG
jgi:hypothetical protein